MTTLSLDLPSWANILRHLLPKPPNSEEAAFLFGRHIEFADTIQVIGYHLLSRNDFLVQAADYLELDDAVRSKLIKHAHDLDACLIEMHSHPGPLAAAFSVFDLAGLREIAPHMLWRLHGKPYVALVVADTSLDALVWRGDACKPLALKTINVGDHILVPTNLTLQSWQ